MNKNLPILLFFFLSLVFAQGQDYSLENYKLSSADTSADYHQIVQNVRAQIEQLKTQNGLSRSLNKKYKHFERWAYFWRDRVSQDGAFPSALEGWNNAGLLNRRGNANNTNASGAKNSQQWTNVGPQSLPDANGFPNPPQMGRLNAFWRYVNSAAANQNVLIVGAPTGGIWKSTDNGATWLPKFDNFAGIGITDIKGTSSDTGTAGVLYATTGDYDAAQVLNSIGVFKSTDMGDTWTATGLTFGLNDAKLLGYIAVIDANTVIVPTTDGISKTTDGGATWTERFTNGTGRGFGRMVISGTNLLVSDQFSGLSVSTDSGDTWTDIVSPGNAGKYGLTVDDNGVFLAQDNAGQIFTVNITAGTLTALGTPSPNYDSQQGYNQTLVRRGGLLVDGSVSGNASSDNGQTWNLSLNGYPSGPSDPGTYVHSDHHQMGYLDSGLSFYSAHDGGLDFIEYASVTDTKPTVTYKSGGVINTQTYAVAPDLTVGQNFNDTNFIMANQDNDGFSNENGTWVAAAAGDGVCAAMNYSDTSKRLLGSPQGGLVRSDGAAGFTGDFRGITVATPSGAGFVWPLSEATNGSSTVFAGFDDMYRSTTAYTAPANTPASTIWTDLNAGVGQITAFENVNTLIGAVGANGVAVSSNNGSTWTTVNPPAGQTITAISMDFRDSTGNTFTVITSGYSSGNKVYSTTDMGATYTNISQGLPNILMKDIAIKATGSPKTTFAATELGVYVKTGTDDWRRLGTNLPNVIVNDLQINYVTDRLSIATYGRGIWTITIAPATLSNDDFALNDDIKVYPNPAVNQVNIAAPLGKEYNYIVFNVLGGTMASGTISNGTQQLDLSSYASGMYIIQVERDGKSMVEKIMKK